MKRVLILLIAISSFTLNSCMQELLTEQEYNGYKPIPVIYSLFSTDDELEVFVLWSIDPKRHYWDQHSDTIKDAEIVLYENGKSLDNLFYDAERGCYKIDGYYPKIGIEYKIKVSVPNYNEEITATSNVPGRTMINVSPDTIYGTNEDLFDVLSEDREQFKHYLKIKVPEQNEPKYFGYGAMTEITESFAIYSPMHLSDSRYHHNKEFYSGPILIFDDRYFVEGKTKIELQSHLFTYSEGNYTYAINNGFTINFEVQVYSLSEEIYFHFASLTNEFWPGGFSDPDIPIETYHDPYITYSNIKGATGVFAGFSKSTYKLNTVIE